jgi:hypothetical protein
MFENNSSCMCVYIYTYIKKIGYINISMYKYKFDLLGILRKFQIN